MKKMIDLQRRSVVGVASETGCGASPDEDLLPKELYFVAAKTLLELVESNDVENKKHLQVGHALMFTIFTCYANTSTDFLIVECESSFL